MPLSEILFDTSVGFTESVDGIVESQQAQIVKPKHEIGEILRGINLDKYNFSYHQKRVLWALRDCRTAALGGHIDACDSCGNIKISYNSCRNRHCPKCQTVEKGMWLVAREEELLPVTYFHVVFTLPHEINDFCRYAPSVIYDHLPASRAPPVAGEALKNAHWLDIVIP